MKLRRRTRRRLKITGGIVLGLAAVGVSAAVATSAIAPPEPPPVSDKVAEAYAKGSTHLATATPTPKPAATVAAKPLPKLTFALGTRAMFFGDSWTYGQGIQPVTEGFAYLTANALGLDAEVDGVPGTGYLNPGPTNAGTYLTRINALPVSDAALLVIQGSVNDQNLDVADLQPAVVKTIDAAKVKFPKAQIVVVGPAGNLKTSDALLSSMDDVMKQAAAEKAVHYISAIDKKWITAANVTSVIDAENNHPSIAGHKTLADDLVAALKALR